jgi:hypothetical protein
MGVLGTSFAEDWTVWQDVLPDFKRSAEYQASLAMFALGNGELW